MPSGRCSGCGHSDSPKKVSTHVVSCPQYLLLHQTDPALCLSPAAEAEKYRRENTAEARAARRDTRLHHRFAELDRLQAAQANRWQRPPDLLDD